MATRFLHNLTSRRFVVYSPDKGSSFGQAPRGRGVRRVFDDVARFIATCTVAQPPSRISLTAYRATQWDDDTSAKRCIELAQARFGMPDEQESVGGQRWPSGEPIKGGHLRWKGAQSNLAEMLDFLASGEPWPKQTLGPVELSFVHQFEWSDSVLVQQQSPEAHPGMIPTSDLIITLSRRSFIQPSLWLPYAPDDDGLRSFLARIDPLLPFKLNSRHFRVAIPKTDGSGFRFAKPSKSLLPAT